MSRVRESVERALQMSRADECIVIGYEKSSANVRWANNTVTTNGVAGNSEIYVISISGCRVGAVGRNYFPDERLERLVRESEAACEGKPEAEDCLPLPDASGTDDDWGEDSPKTGIEVFDGFAPELGGLLRKAESSNVKLFGFAEHVVSTLYLATSAGVRRRHVQPSGQVEINAKSEDFTRSVWKGISTRDFADVDLQAIYAGLDERLGWSEKFIEMEPGRYEAVLEPSPVADMLIYAYWTAEAREADEGRTVFSKPGGGNRIGEKMFPSGITIHSDPGEPGLEVRPFQAVSGSYFWDRNVPEFEVAPSTSAASVFDNGLSVSRTDWVRDGVLTNLITPRWWGGKTSGRGAPYTPNLIFENQGASLDEMISSTERGLLATSFWYMRQVDPQTLLVTGLTRDGLFLVEGGKVKGAVNNFRFNMSPIDMLAQTVEVGEAEQTLPREFGDYFTFARMPPIRVENFNMSSVSEAV